LCLATALVLSPSCGDVEAVNITFPKWPDPLRGLVADGRWTADSRFSTGPTRAGHAENPVENPSDQGIHTWRPSILRRGTSGRPAAVPGLRLAWISAVLVTEEKHLGLRSSWQLSLVSACSTLVDRRGCPL